MALLRISSLASYDESDDDENTLDITSSERSRTYSHALPDLLILCYNSNFDINVYTVNFLNIWTPKQIVVMTLKFELCGSTIE